MKVGELKKVLSIMSDDSEISLEIYRNGKMDSSTILNSVEVNEDLTYVTLKGVFFND